MRKFLTAIAILTVANTFAQVKDAPTTKFSIVGKVKKESVITLDSLKQYQLKRLGNIKITDHLGNFKHQDDQLKGVLLKDVLRNTVYAVASPKLLSTFYFVCTAADGYKVVYSWNELYNTTVGDNVFIIREKNGVAIEKMPERIQMVSYADFKTGRRYLHHLDKIIVAAVE